MTKSEAIAKMRKKRNKFNISSYDIGFRFIFKLCYLIPLIIVSYIPVAFYYGIKEIKDCGLLGIKRKYMSNIEEVREFESYLKKFDK